MNYPDAWGLKYEEVMGLTWLAYKGRGTAGNWDIDGKKWTIGGGDVHEHGSFRAVVAHGSRTVLCLSGTDDLGDWEDNIMQGGIGVSRQYLRALGLARSSGASIVVGHSLGGGMASYCAIYGGKLAATINPAPLNFNLVSAIQMIRNGVLVINYVAIGEILAIADAVTGIMLEKVGQTYHVSSRGGWWNPVARHGIANLEGFVEPKPV